MIFVSQKKTERALTDARRRLRQMGADANRVDLEAAWGRLIEALDAANAAWAEGDPEPLIG